MRGVIQRSILFVATFAALFLLCAPNAQAQQPPAFDAANCQQTMQTALFKGAQDYYAAEANVFANAELPTMNQGCIGVGGILSAIQALGATTDPFALIWQLVFNNIILPMINQIVQHVCQAITSAINAAVSFVKNAICLPLPGFGANLNFNLGSFGGKSCNGIAVIPLIAGAALGAARTGIPGVWIRSVGDAAMITAPRADKKLKRRRMIIRLMITLMLVFAIVPPPTPALARLCFGLRCCSKQQITSAFKAEDLQSRAWCYRWYFSAPFSPLCKARM